MQTLQIDKQKARKLYPGASEEIKAIFEESFGKDFFSQKITDRVKSFDDILAISGRTMESLVNINDEMDEIAYKQAKLIAQVYNEGTVLDAKDTSQYKYYPWHNIVKDAKVLSGCGLSYYDCAYWATYSVVGVRLCFKSAALAEDAGKKFISIYEQLKIN